MSVTLVFESGRAVTCDEVIECLPSSKAAEEIQQLRSTLREAVAVIERAESMLDHVGCPQNCDDGVVACGEHPMPCQWCDEKKVIIKGFLAAHPELRQREDG